MLLNHLVLLIIGVLLITHQGTSYNILVIFGHPGRSHYDVFVPFFQTLAAQGHHMTILSHLPLEPSENIRHISLGDHSLVHVVNLQLTGQHRWQDYSSQPKFIADMATENCMRDLQNPSLQDFLKEDHRFDVILGETFNTNCYYGLVTKIRAPFIGLSSCAYMPWHADWFGVPANPAYVQNIFGGFEAPMSFWSRVENTFLNFYVKIWYKLAMEKPGNEWSKRHLGYEAADPHNASLILVNTHYTLHGVQPLPPSVIEVGGIHVTNKRPKKLPQDIENWINNSDAGVIYFSLGSMIKGDTFPEERRRAFARAFAKLSQRVLWKWENDTMPDKPDNVMIAKWMPQFDVLSHPNVKLFISHGGLLGTTEAVHWGVPMIVMPQFGDQRHNAYAIVNSGVGVMLHLQSATEETVGEALKKALDPQILKNAKAVAERFRDRPMSPMDTAVYWVEHVARHKGARHMRSPNIDLPFYQYYLLDVMAFLVSITLVLVYVFYQATRLVLALTISSRSKGEKRKTS